jgi:hypothetical protein
MVASFMLLNRLKSGPLPPDMFELIETNLTVDVQDSEYRRLLGYPKSRALDGRARELADAARQWYAENGRPWIFAWQAGTPELANGRLRLSGTEFSSKQLHDQFAEAQADNAVLVAVSAGPECEGHAQQLWSESKPDEYFFLETLGSAVVEHLVTVANGRICSWADENDRAALPHYSPGFSGWEVSDQIKLWQVLRQNSNSNLPGELDVLDSGMLRPKKSLLAVVGLTRDMENARRLARLIPCEHCSLPNCRYRRAAYKRSRAQLEVLR